MIAGGFDQDHIITINNFFNTDKLNPVLKERANYYCYVGRLSKEKGVETLLKAATNLPQYQLKIIGTGPLYEYFVKEYNSTNIEYLGYRISTEVQEILVTSLIFCYAFRML